ncbi:DUF4065 domain-containing protein [Clostridium botulinum]|nr:DUF4065 domain-containing protein [Clostridium botulinum]NFS95359.1 DUF4065 domain-containing protein [Clostridium botulinum]
MRDLYRERGDCMHTALEIARYIINKCIELGRPVSNLQLQKILYYVQGEYMKHNNGEPLFEDDIVAWQYGPVVTSVYYEYNCYSSSNIREKQEETNLDSDEIGIINPIIDNKSNLSAWTLVQKTHSEDPWINAYKRYDGSTITKEELEDWFLN